MIQDIKSFLYRKDTGTLHKEKIVSIIVLALTLIGLFFYGKTRNKKIDNERIANARYVIGKTIKQYKNLRSPNPTVKYAYMFADKEYSSFEEIPDSLHGKIVVDGGRYYVQFSYKQPDNCKLLFMCPVPDSIKEAPVDGWTHIPGKEN